WGPSRTWGAPSASRSWPGSRAVAEPAHVPHVAALAVLRGLGARVDPAARDLADDATDRLLGVVEEPIDVDRVDRDRARARRDGEVARVAAHDARPPPRAESDERRSERLLAQDARDGEEIDLELQLLSSRHGLARLAVELVLAELV